MRFIFSRLYTLLFSPCIWSRTGTPILNGFALLILSIVALVLIVKATPVLVASAPGLMLYKAIKKPWQKWFGKLGP